jgi:hypothetical protein
MIKRNACSPVSFHFLGGVKKGPAGKTVLLTYI